MRLDIASILAVLAGLILYSWPAGWRSQPHDHRRDDAMALYEKACAIPVSINRVFELESCRKQLIKLAEEFPEDASLQELAAACSATIRETNLAMGRNE